MENPAAHHELGLKAKLANDYARVAAALADLLASLEVDAEFEAPTLASLPHDAFGAGTLQFLAGDTAWRHAVASEFGPLFWPSSHAVAGLLPTPKPPITNMPKYLN